MSSCFLYALAEGQLKTRVLPVGFVGQHLTSAYIPSVGFRDMSKGTKEGCSFGVHSAEGLGGVCRFTVWG